ncbi:MAG: (Fe-S)-binding protein [Candidatus Lokiarchaeota archaeon]|nr:(Fe-S)-binding protein [Candidatus Lokiarchaeota archaeon]
MFDVNKCSGCGTCLMSCPVIDLNIDQAKEEIQNLINGSSFIVNQCAVCGTCDLNCPENLTPMELIKNLKYAQMEALKEKGQVPQVVNFMLPFNSQNIFKMYENTMMPPENLQKLKKWKSPQKSDELVLLGCAISYIYQDFYDNSTIKGLLEGKNIAGGLDFCCGELYHRLCYPISKPEVEEHLNSKFSALGTDKLIVFCNECHEAYRNEYKKIAQNYKIISIWEYISNAIESGELKIKNNLNFKVVYHDPCSVKKYPELLNHPRKIIEATGAELIELDHNRENALCCGLALGLNGISQMGKIRKKRLEEVSNTGADIIVNSCPGCIINFAMDRKVRKDKFKIISVLELLRMACGEKIDLNRHPQIINELINKSLSMASTLTQNL